MVQRGKKAFGPVLPIRRAEDLPGMGFTQDIRDGFG